MPADRRRLILIGLIVVLLLCLVGVVGFNVFNRGGGGDNVAQEPTPTLAPTEAPTPEPPEPTEEPEPTATLVVEEPTATPQPEPSPTPAEVEAEAMPAEDEATTNGGGAADESGAGTEMTVRTTTEMVEVTETGEILKNGDFEAGFAENGVGVNWLPFRTDAADVNFSTETAEVFVQGGQFAQRISIDNAYQADQYGGIFQTVDVVPGETYTLTIQGQIRSGFGSVQSSNYGYRVQYALDHSGGQNWRGVTQTHWVELPWPEQSLDVSNAEFSEANVQFTPTGDKTTLFIRAWNKWPDGTLGEYTLDELSIVGPDPTSTELIAVTVTTPADSTGGDDAATALAPPSQEEVVDKGLPVTGLGDTPPLMQDGRFWGAIMVLLLLVAGAVYRSGWRW